MFLQSVAEFPSMPRWPPPPPPPQIAGDGRETQQQTVVAAGWRDDPQRRRPKKLNWESGKFCVENEHLKGSPTTSTSCCLFLPLLDRLYHSFQEWGSSAVLLTDMYQTHMICARWSGLLVSNTSSEVCRFCWIGVIELDWTAVFWLESVLHTQWNNWHKKDFFFFKTEVLVLYSLWMYSFWIEVLSN